MNENNEIANNGYLEIPLLDISVKVTEDEEKAILGADKKTGMRVLSNVIADHRLLVNSSPYIPETCVEPAPKISDDDLKELRGQLVDIVEDYMTEKCVPDKDAVFIKGDDYDKLADKFIETLKNWNLF